jgi:hypothetical protein
MPMYMIERDVPGAHGLTPDQQAEIATTSCNVLDGMGPGITWHQSYRTENKITCIYEADNEQLIRDHAQKGGFPVTRISEVAGVLSPSLARR